MVMITEAVEPIYYTSTIAYAKNGGIWTADCNR